jgi:acyl transferase domain-containing protein
MGPKDWEGVLKKSKRRSVAEDVAIIGMAARFPGAPNISQFWANLRDGVESISPLSAEDLVDSNSSQELQNPSFVPVASAIEDIDLFDAPFFGFSPREAG